MKILCFKETYFDELSAIFSLTRFQSFKETLSMFKYILLILSISNQLILLNTNIYEKQHWLN